MSLPAHPRSTAALIRGCVAAGLLLAAAALPGCETAPDDSLCAPICDSEWTFSARCWFSPMVSLLGPQGWRGFLAEEMKVPGEVTKDGAFVVSLGNYLNVACHAPRTRCDVRVDRERRLVLLYPQRNVECTGEQLQAMYWFNLPCLVEPLGAAGLWTIMYSPDIEFITGKPSPSRYESLPKMAITITEETP